MIPPSRRRGGGAGWAAESPGHMRWIAVAVAALLVGLLTYGVTAQGTSTSIDQALSEGRRVAAPDATLPTLGATGSGSLKQYRGKVVLLNFWASWCPPCVKELTLLERTHKQMTSKGGVVVGINTRDASEDALKFVDRFHLTFPSLRDGPGDFAEKWGLTGYPETFVLDRKGEIAAARRGP